MIPEDQFPEAPPIRLNLSESESDSLEGAKPPGQDSFIIGYAGRRSDPQSFRAVAWFIEREALTAALEAAGILYSKRQYASRNRVRKKKPITNRKTKTKNQLIHGDHK